MPYFCGNSLIELLLYCSHTDIAYERTHFKIKFSTR